MPPEEEVPTTEEGKEPEKTEETPAEEEGGEEEVTEGEEEEETEAEEEPEEEEGDDETTSLRARNLVLETQLLEHQRQERLRKEGKPEEEPEETEEELLAQLEKNPIGTIKKIVAKAKAETRKELSSQTQLLNAVHDDKARAQGIFPELNEDETFLATWSKIHSALVDEHGSEFPGAASFARLAAYGLRELNMRQAKGKTTTKDDGKKPGVKERVRRASEPGVKSDKGREPEKGKYSDKDFSADELAQIDKLCKQGGMTREQYFASYSKLKAGNPSYA